MTNAETTDKAATVGEQGAHVAPVRASSKKRATREKGAPRGQKASKGSKNRSVAPKKEAKGGKKAAAKTKAERANKKAEVIAMMKRAKGATLSEIAAATGWRKHTVRGFVSVLGSKGGQKVESAKNDAGERTYRIVK